jgi:exodeoxyribonuclease V alpha subunit
VQLEGQVEHITFRNPDTGYTVLRLATRDRRVRVVGTFHGVRVGEHLRVEGDMVEHPVYGPQLRAQRYELFVPTTREGLVAYLGGGLVPGVGPRLAERLVKAFGERTLEVIASSPQRVAQVPGIGPLRARALREKVLANRESEPVMVFLEGQGLSPGLARRIYERYGPGAVGVVKENPYRLAEEVRGVGFRLADRIAMAVGFDPTSPWRAQAAAEYLLTEAEGEGHCFLPQSRLAQELARLLGTPQEPAPVDIKAAVEALRLRGRVVVEPLPAQEGEKPDWAVYRTPVHRWEVRAAQGLARLLRTPAGPLRPQEGQGAAFLSPEQRRAVEEALRQRVFVLTGGPGTGKTTVVRHLLESFRASQVPCLLGAPTGRAAKRLAEATGWPARTLHRLLEYGRRGEDRGEEAGEAVRFGFAYGPDNPLPTGAVVVDEMSMVDLWLFSHLVDALPSQARLILVGDHDQLPSVGAGNVLRDLLASGLVPSVQLTHIYRQEEGSLIARNAQRILHGQMPVFSGHDGEFTMDEQVDPEACARRVVELAQSLGDGEEVQVLTPMRKGPAGVEALNLLLQERANPPRPGVPELRLRSGTVLRLGDKVMQVRNDYAKGVFNGDSGTVVGLSPSQGEVRVRYPEPEGDREVVYRQGELEEITLAYAVSVHKSQGSEYPVVVLALLPQHYLLLQRNLLYTAVTRARRRVAIVGQRRAVAMALGNNRVAQRHTMFARRLATSLEAGADLAPPWMFER